jgi:MoxR-like ATPase
MLKGGSPRDHLDQLTSLFTKTELIKIQDQVKEVHISDVVVEYVQEILIRARVKNYPLSPRAGLQLIQAAKAWAYLSDRAFVIPEDIQDIAGPVLTHRIPRAEASTIQQLLTEIAVP